MPDGRGKVVSQEIPRQLQESHQLHQRLLKAGAYERLQQLDPRQAILLQTYLTTEKTVKEVGEEAGFRSRTRAQEVLYNSITIAFFALPEDQQAEYRYNPRIALQTRSTVQTQTKSERITLGNQRSRQKYREQNAAHNGFPESSTGDTPETSQQ